MSPRPRRWRGTGGDAWRPCARAGPATPRSCCGGAGSRGVRPSSSSEEQARSRAPSPARRSSRAAAPRKASTLASHPGCGKTSSADDKVFLFYNSRSQRSPALSYRGLAPVAYDDCSETPGFPLLADGAFFWPVVGDLGKGSLESQAVLRAQEGVQDTGAQSSRTAGPSPAALQFPRIVDRGARRDDGAVHPAEELTAAGAFAASWPHAASMSCPRVSRTVAPQAVLLERRLERGDRLAPRAVVADRSGCRGSG